MGAADLVPGVSGGTVAFITGIYARLLAALAAFASRPMLQDAFAFRVSAAWRRGDCTFLAALGAGVVCAVFSLGGVLHYLLETRAHLLLAFFCGLVPASAMIAARRLRAPAPQHFTGFVLGAFLGFAAATFPAPVFAPTAAAFFVGGAIAICAMLLPGISGSYILLVVGLYAPVINALHSRDWMILFIFVGGCLFGLLAFSRLLNFLLRRFHDGVLALLIGVMLGAMPKLWPWKEHAAGVKIILQPNVMPAAFAGDPQTGAVVLLAGGGAFLVVALYLAGRRKSA